MFDVANDLIKVIHFYIPHLQPENEMMKEVSTECYINNQFFLCMHNLIL